MRGICLVLAMLVVPTVALAQHQAPPQRGAVSGPISGSLPSLGLPLPPLGLSPRVEPRPVYGGPSRSGPQRDGHQRDFQQREWLQTEWQRGGQRDNGRPRGSGNPFGYRPGPAYIFVGPQYPYMPSADVIMQATVVPGAITVVPEPMTGTLLIEVEPADILQVFVDGAYVGTPRDLGSALELQPGSRRIEFRAPGYKTLTIDAQIVSRRTIVYRATLDRIPPTRVVPPPAAAPEPPFVPSGNRTLYMIPGCYMGNVPPQDVRLPAGCDASRVTTIKP